MPRDSGAPVRRAVPADAASAATLLDAFNREYDDATPGVAVLTRRLQALLAGDAVAAFLAGEPATGVALVTLRPNVWSDGPVGLLDELYVVPHLRGGGRGAALLAAAEAFVAGLGGSLLEVPVDGDDVAARRFYERHGYRNTDGSGALLTYLREL